MDLPQDFIHLVNRILGISESLFERSKELLAQVFVLRVKPC